MFSGDLRIKLFNALTLLLILTVNNSVAVSGEFYSLTITDTHSGRVLHVEDLKGLRL